MTKRLLRWIGEQGLNRTFVSIANEIGVHEKTVRAAFADHQRHINQKVRLKPGQCMAIVKVKAFHGERYAVLDPVLGILTDWIESTGKKAMVSRLKSLALSEGVKRVGVGFEPDVLACVAEAFPSANTFIDPSAVQASLEKGIHRALAALRAQMSPYACMQVLAKHAMIGLPLTQENLSNLNWIIRELERCDRAIQVGDKQVENRFISELGSTKRHAQQTTDRWDMMLSRSFKELLSTMDDIVAVILVQGTYH